MAKRMTFNVPHGLDLSAALERVRALGDYFQNRHGIAVDWRDDVHAQLNGRYLLVTFAANVAVKEDAVYIDSKDPGMLLRNKAIGYLRRKLETYLDPATPVESLQRS